MKFYSNYKKKVKIFFFLFFLFQFNETLRPLSPLLSPPPQKNKLSKNKISSKLQKLFMIKCCCMLASILLLLLLQEKKNRREEAKIFLGSFFFMKYKKSNRCKRSVPPFFLFFSLSPFRLRPFLPSTFPFIFFYYSIHLVHN